MNTKPYAIAAISLIAFFTSAAFGQKVKAPEAPSVPDIIEIPGGVFASSYIVEASGSYRLAGDRSLEPGTGASAIIISAPNVVIDLGGHVLSGFGSSASASGIETVVPAGGAVENIRIESGTIQGFGKCGILAPVDRVVVENVRSLDNGTRGIQLSLDSMVRDCIVTDNGADGVFVAMGRVLNTVSSKNGGTGIQISTGRIEGCEVSYNGNSGIAASGNSIIHSNRVLYNNSNDIVYNAGIFVYSSSQVSENYLAENRGSAIRFGSGSIARDNTIVNVIYAANGIFAVVSTDPTAVAVGNMFSGKVDAMVGGLLDGGGNILLQGAY